MNWFDCCIYQFSCVLCLNLLLMSLIYIIVAGKIKLVPEIVPLQKKLDQFCYYQTQSVDMLTAGDR